MRWGLILLVGLLCVPEVGFSQTRIDPSNFNSELLSRLILKEVNDYRADHSIDALSKESPCILAAKDHCKYILRSGKYDHKQPSENKKYAKQRVRYYNGTYEAVGENLNEILYDQPFRFYGEDFDAYHVVTTYEEAARLIVYGWTTSRSHKRTMLNNHYHFTGIATGFDRRQNKIYAVQVFGGTY